MDADRRITRSPTQARQGVELHRMRYVLWISLVAAIVLVGGVMIYFRVVA